MTRVLISGSHGLIGSAIVDALSARGDEVVRLVRSRVDAASSAAGGGAVSWSPQQGTIEVGAIGGFDAVVHLAGESIFGRWTAAKRARILDSRVQGTSLLAGALAGLSLNDRPEAFVCASAIGWYGDRGDEVLTERSSPGLDGFLVQVTRAWEAAADPARDALIRTVHVRTGVVQSPLGGALATQLPIYRLGLGGPLGRGRQWMSWVTLDDVVAAYLFAIDEPRASGAVNATAPEPVTSLEYARTLGRVLRRPAVLPVPKAGMRLAYGGLADELFTSQRVLPRVLEQIGFVFRHRELEPALREMLGR